MSVLKDDYSVAALSREDHTRPVLREVPDSRVEGCASSRSLALRRESEPLAGVRRAER